MAEFWVNGKLLFVSSGGEVRVSLFGPPLLVLNVREDNREKRLPWHVSMKSAGEFTLDEKSWHLSLVGMSLRPDRSSSVYGVLSQKETLEWFGQPVEDVGGVFTLVYQRGLKEKMRAYLERIVNGGNDDKRFLAGGTEDEIGFPPEGGCLLRPAAMTNRDFLNQIVSVSAAVDPRMLGWRLVPRQGMDRVVFSIGDEGCSMAAKDWDVVSEDFGSQRATIQETPSVVRHVLKQGKYKRVRTIMDGLFGKAVPGTGVFGGGGEIPGAPGWVKLGGEARFARSVSATFEEPDFESKATLHHVDVELSSRPPEPPREGLDLRTRIVEAVVDDWTNGGTHLRLKVPEAADWKMSAAEDEGGTLDVRYVVPAMFGEEQKGPGSALYLNPGKGDPRTVVLTQGGVPVSAGAFTENWAKGENKEIDVFLASRKTTVAMKNEGFFAGIEDKSELNVDRAEVTVSVKNRFHVFDQSKP